ACVPRGHARVGHRDRPRHAVLPRLVEPRPAHRARDRALHGPVPQRRAREPGDPARPDRRRRQRPDGQPDVLLRVRRLRAQRRPGRGPPPEPGAAMRARWIPIAAALCALPASGQSPQLPQLAIDALTSFDSLPPTSVLNSAFTMPLDDLKAIALDSYED